ncbi:acyltransferase [Microbispora rosea subsp. aerata]|nr:acyltransferase [Microbispora rosea]GGO12471.1 acyltransferase [Microbispora rosea subsp. aerata]GIH54067.1 acyltransferase [Microbispora rosea subsp. aerata]GLJ85040.1 acyltransferase [Microbispora rosea subsp. aerata]
MLAAAPRIADASANPSGPSRLRVLDLLRFCAALGVVVFHFAETRAWGTPNAFPTLSAVTMFGVYGVRLFFLISGFVILMSAWGRTPGRFAASRIARLFPAYWASVLILGGLAVAGLITDHRPSLTELLANMTMLQHGFSVRDLEIVYWTLWQELVFYALIACFAAVGITYRRCLGFMGAWVLLLAIADRVNADLLQAVLVPFSAPYFIAGMALYLIHRFGGSLFPWLFVGAGWTLGLYTALDGEPTAIRRFGPALGSALVVGVISLIFLVMILVAVGAFDRVDWRWLTFLGTLTYPLYLFHHHVGFLLIQWLHPVLGNRVTLPLVVAAVLVVAYGVHRLVERPLQPRMRAALERSLAADAGRVRETAAGSATPSTSGPTPSTPGSVPAGAEGATPGPVPATSAPAPAVVAPPSPYAQGTAPRPSYLPRGG